MIWRIALILLVCVAGTPLALQAQERKPLLMEGKTTLYQKVLTRPGASLAEGPGAPGTEPMDPFTVLYVYQRFPVDGGGPTYLEVGTDAKGAVSGFLKETETVPWDHALVLAFTERGNRDRVLFLEDEAALDGWLKDPNLAVRAEDARQRADARNLPEDSPVLSIEPETFIDFASQFYMLPILEAKPKRLPDRRRAMGVRIASVTRDEEEQKLQLVSTRENIEALGDFRAGVVFVIDASSSMQPYISRTREVMRDVLEKVADADLSDKVRFGVVGYRDDPAAVQGVGYLTRTFADPNQIQTATDFKTAVEPLSASRVSTRAFAEDAFAAIDHAMGRIDWNGFDARYLILITDASARDASSHFASLKLNAADMRNDVKGRSASLPTAIYALHLQTPVGKDDHAKAEAQYIELTRLDSGRSLYYPVPSGDPEAFQGKVGALADALVEQVRTTRDAKNAADLANAPEPPKDEADDDIRDAAAEVGRAMALAYLGRVSGAKAPPMFEAWASDRDFANPAVPAFSVRLLLSKNQLSDLQRTMNETVRALDAGQIDPGDFFNQLRSAATAMGRDPNRVGQGEARNLAETGLMGEYLDGLPYQSRIMSLTEDDWARMSVGEQQSIIDDVNSKIRLYQRFHDDSDRWIALNEGDDAGDWVYPVPLDALP
ncbi:MAG: VWA domain-containing protein [Minwuia sp.]|uniref:VWA domain-containing protein n=1 Tax=Minwuia sp. TaxID=2493630 RepID=UPI003A87CABE